MNGIALKSLLTALLLGVGAVGFTSAVQAGPHGHKPHHGKVDYRYAPQPRYHHAPPKHYHRAPPPHARAWGHPSRYDQRVNFRRGDRLPSHYFANRYYVNDWRRHPGLYAPPRGQRWMEVDGRYVLAAVATGVITSIIFGH